MDRSTTIMRTRRTLHRLEMLVLMAGIELPIKAVRRIAGGFDLLVHISRLVDGRVA